MNAWSLIRFLNNTGATLVKLQTLIKRYLCVFALSFLLCACAKKPETTSIRIATAANMQFAMKELAADFTKKTRTECELVISSSGKLTAQIKEGAPYDVFVAADVTYPEAVYAAGMGVAKPKIYAYGKLVLWSYTSSIKPTLEMLTSDSINHIALANPKTAPYGSAAVSVLEKEGLYTKVFAKLVYGESIAQTNQFITSGAAEIGFTALAVVKAPSQKSQGSWTLIDRQLYEPIAQAVVVLKSENGKQKKAQAFYDYLFSSEAQKILQDYGYSVDE